VYEGILPNEENDDDDDDGLIPTSASFPTAHPTTTSSPGGSSGTVPSVTSLYDSEDNQNGAEVLVSTLQLRQRRRLYPF
jgi:hypothetical protein